MTFLKVFQVGKERDDRSVLKAISFEQQQFEKIAIAGETGAGKSTLLKVIAGLEQASGGEVRFDGEPVKGPSEKLVPGHEAISYLSQHFELPKFLRVEQVLTYSNRIPDKRADAIYRVCRIKHLLKRTTHELSGGEKQRIAIAKLLVSSPKLLLLDEPFSNLDVTHKNILRDIIREIGEKLAVTFIIVSHEPDDVLSWAEQILVLRSGRVVQRGTPEEIYRRPVNEYVAGLFGEYNSLKRSNGKRFPKEWKLKGNKKKIIVRPEDFYVSKRTRKSGVAGKVHKIYFHGSYYQAEVTFPFLKDPIHIKMYDPSIKEKDTVYVSLASESAWYL